MKAFTRTLIIAVIFFSLVGIVDSGYAIKIHYDLSDESFCNFGTQFNCDVVNGSKYAEIQGVPVAAVGFAGYLVFMILAVSLLAGFSLRGLALPVLIGAAVFAVAFSLYLTYVEIFILETVCLLCVISQSLVILILLAATGLWFALRSTRRPA